MRIVVTVLTVLLAMSASAQYNLDVSMDNETGNMIYVGQCTFKDLSSEQTFTWLRTGVGHYNPNRATVSYLSSNLKDYNMVVFMGTWCDDSHKLLPQVYKLLRLTSYPMKQYTMYGLDMDKVGYADEHERYNIEQVPTVILLSDGKEVGRITEAVTESLEMDLKKIILDHKNNS